nr:MAG TPA: hypothetical protein [Caudoviricetes sp.]
MKYKLESTPRFDKEFKKLDRYTQRFINYGRNWIYEI